MDTDAARKMALVGVEFCFNHDCNAKSLQRIDWMGGYDGWRAMVAAMPSIVAESRWRKVGVYGWWWCCLCCFAVAVFCFAVKLRVER